MTGAASQAVRRPTLWSSSEGLAAAGVALAAAGMLWFTWGTWPDPLNDSGRELYVAWQLAAGKVLYRDVAYFNGPLSPYVNAAWFALTGPGIYKLEALNAAVFLAIAVVTWYLVRCAAGWGVAAASTLVLVTVFAFGPLTVFGSFTYLLPYSHEMTHGVLLCLLLLATVDRFWRRQGAGTVFVAGFLLGLTLLTKPEFAIAGCAATAVGFGLGAARDGGRRLAVLPLLPFAAAIPPILAWGALATAMPVRVALEGILGSWAHLNNRTVTGMPYFRMFMGIDRPIANAAWMVAWSVAWAGVLAAAIGAGRALCRFRRSERPVAATLALGVAAILVVSGERIPWRDAFRPLPLVSLAVLIWALLRWRRVPSGSSEPRAGLVLAAAAAAMSLALTLKMFLLPRVWHYGFVLGMPAAMLAVAALLRAGSSWTRGAGGSPVIAGGVLAGVLAGAIAGHLRLMSETIALRTHPVGRGSDAFHTDARGVVVEEALEAIDRIAPAGATLAALPDGVLLNYLARRPNSTPYVIGNPVDVAIFEEERMLEAYREAPPDFIVMFVCDTMIYGVPGFGRGYAERLDAWIEANYEGIGIAGTGQAPDNPFRAVVLRRRGSSR